MQVWLIEVNVNPALHTNCTTLASISPAVVQETLGRGRPRDVHASTHVYIMHCSLTVAIAIEVFGKCRRNKSPLPISTLNYFSLILPKS